MNIRPATPDDADAFHRYVTMTSSEYDFFFAPKTKQALADFFRRRNNIFSHEHTRFAEIGGRTAGMILSYSGRRQQAGLPLSIIIFLKNLGANVITKLPPLIQFAAASGTVDRLSYYISTIVIDPEFRRRGLATDLLCFAEQKARETGCKMISLDMEKDNEPAVALYKALGFCIVREYTLKFDARRSYYSMSKNLK